MRTTHILMQRLSPLLVSPHAPLGWQIVLFGQMLLVCWLAFDPTPRAPSVGQADKLQHLLAFTTLSFAARWAWAARHANATGSDPTSTRRDLGPPALGMLAFGVLIEVVQAFIPARSASLADVLADAVGIALGLCLALAARRWLARQVPGMQVQGQRDGNQAGG